MNYRKTRCQALDPNGKQCSSRKTKLSEYHGDSELYGPLSTRKEPGWVKVYLCDKHRER